MRAAIIAAVALATFSSFPVTAQQQQEPSAQQQTAPAQPGAPGATPDSQPTQNPAQNGAPTQASAAPVTLEPVKGELVGKLDSNSAKTGDSVVVKTKENVKTADGTEIPKGSKLVGRVTGVQPRGEGKENSQIALKFDHAELKGGQNLAIESVLQSVSPASGSDSAMNNGDNLGSPTGSAPSSGGPGSGGSMSGSANSSGTNGTATNSTGQGSMQNSGQPSGQPGASTSSTGAPAPGSIVARSGNIAIRMTAIPGVLLANNMNGQPFSNASGLLLGAKSDIKLEGGTQVVVAVASVPGGGTSGASMNR